MDATVKVLCYKSKTLANGEHPLMVCICKDRKRKYQSLGISIHPTHWDFKKNEPNEFCPNRDEIRFLIQQKLYDLQKTILNKRIEGKDFTASSLLKSNATSSCLHNNVEECITYYISMLKEQGRLRYAGMYEVSHNSFVKFNNGSLELPFNDIDVVWLKKGSSRIPGAFVKTAGSYAFAHKPRFHIFNNMLSGCCIELSSSRRQLLYKMQQLMPCITNNYVCSYLNWCKKCTSSTTS